MSFFNKQLHNKGFTLIELLIVLVLLSILSIGMTSYISTGTEIYKIKASQSRTLSSVRFVMARLQKDILMAFPSSLRVKDNCLEFIPARVAVIQCELDNSCTDKKSRLSSNKNLEIAPFNGRGKKVNYCFSDLQLKRNNIQMTDKNVTGKFSLLKEKKLVKILFNINIDKKEIGFEQTVDFSSNYLGVK